MLEFSSVPQRRKVSSWEISITEQDGVGSVDDTAEFMLCSPPEILLGLHVGRTMAKRTVCLFLDLPQEYPDSYNSHPVSAGNLVLRTVQKSKFHYLFLFFKHIIHLIKEHWGEFLKANNYVIQ